MAIDYQDVFIIETLSWLMAWLACLRQPRQGISTLMDILSYIWLICKLVVNYGLSLA